jgi:hypothetical protein
VVPYRSRIRGHGEHQVIRALGVDGRRELKRNEPPASEPPGPPATTAVSFTNPRQVTRAPVR